MLEQDMIQAVMQQGSYFALFAGFFYWFLTKYLPAQTDAHKNQIAELQMTFKESLDKIVDTFQNSTSSINSRLDTIEDDIGKIKKVK